ncbi:hypothetical protein MtrunA17_Chr7g0266811 [Medicago truncatula]|nr:hypothetical protein MtrunA17_Chr7g0266811 [Medicago truncatula]
MRKVGSQLSRLGFPCCKDILLISVSSSHSQVSSSLSLFRIPTLHSFPESLGFLSSLILSLLCSGFDPLFVPEKERKKVKLKFSHWKAIVKIEIQNQITLVLALEIVLGLQFFL